MLRIDIICVCITVYITVFFLANLLDISSIVGELDCLAWIIQVDLFSYISRQ